MGQNLISNDDVVIAANEPIVHGAAVDDSAGDIVLRTSGVERARINKDGVGTGLLGSSQPFSVCTYGGVGDAKKVADAAITSGANILTSASAAFTSTDVGKKVFVLAAGAAGVTLVTTISGYTNATTVTLAANAGATVSGATAAYGTDNATAITATIAAASAGRFGGVVFFPLGTYLTTGAHSITTGSVRVSGFGKGLSTILRAGNVTTLTITGVGTGSHIYKNALTDILIDGGSATDWTSTLVQQSYLSEPIMRDFNLFGAGGIALDQLEVWDAQTENVTLSACGGNASGTLPAHNIRCSAGDTSNNIHLRGYWNEAFGADGALVASNNSSNQPVNIILTDYKFERHANVGIVMKATQGVNVKLGKGNVAISGGLASGVSQGVDLFTFAGGRDVEVSEMYLSFGSFSANDVRSLFNLDGSTNTITGATLRDILLASGSGSKPLADIRFAGTVDRYREDNVRWNSNFWAAPHWSGTPTSISPFGPVPSIAGTVSDSSFDTTSVDGAVAVDSTGSRLAFRTGGAWKHLSPTPSVAGVIAGSTGKWYTVPGSGTTAAPTNGTVHATPFLVNTTQTFTGIAVNVPSVAGAAGSVTRLGIYNDNGSAYPGTLLLDAGTVASTGTGWLTITISQSLTPGLYWLAAVTQGTPATVPTYTGVATHNFMIATTFTATVPFGYTMTQAGALSGTFAASVSSTSAPVRVWLGT